MGRGMAPHTACHAGSLRGEGCGRTGVGGAGWGGLGTDGGRERAREAQASPGTLLTLGELGKCQVQSRLRETDGKLWAVTQRLVSRSRDAAGLGAHR